MAKWKKEKPIHIGGLRVGCLNCSTASYIAPMNLHLPVGVGSAGVTKDGHSVWGEQESELNIYEPGYESLGDNPTVSMIEEIAAKDPDHDWRIHRHGPMHGEVYQRHKKGEWVCIESDDGFA